jgi:hypothetical protein
MIHITLLSPGGLLPLPGLKEGRSSQVKATAPDPDLFDGARLTNHAGSCQDQNIKFSDARKKIASERDILFAPQVPGPNKRENTESKENTLIVRTRLV